MPEASPFWQNAFLVGVFVVLGWGAWSGWRAGVVRTVMSLGGMLIGGFVGMAVGGLVGSLLGAWLPLPGILLGVLAGILVGFIVYFAIWVLGALLFKRTAQQRTGLLRFFFGAGGAVVGVAVGMTIIWGTLLFIRSLGGFYEARFLPSASAALAEPHVATAALVKLKRSIEAGSTGRQLMSIDIVPTEFYRVFGKLGEVSVRPAAVIRFLEYPAVAEAMRDPKIVAITADPEACDAARAQNIGQLLSNRKFIAAANDPALLAKLQKIHIEKALDYALSTP